MYGFLARPMPLAMLAASGTHHSGRAVFWIIGWLVVLAVIVGVVIYLVRRRNPRPPRDQWPQGSSADSRRADEQTPRGRRP